MTVLFSDMSTLSTVVAIVADLWVLIVTWKKTADIWKFSLKNHQFKPALSTLLIRDGKVEYLLLFLLSLFLFVAPRHPIFRVSHSAFTFTAGV